MKPIQKKIVVDDTGRPQEVAEILGLDLDDEAVEDLRQARRDREERIENAYIDLESLR